MSSFVRYLLLNLGIAFVVAGNDIKTGWGLLIQFFGYILLCIYTAVMWGRR